MIEGKDLFDFSHSLAGERLQCAEMPWEALAQISAWICEIGAALEPCGVRGAESPSLGAPQRPYRA